MRNDLPGLAEAVNARMRELGFTQREVTEHSGVAATTLRRIQAAEPGRRNQTTLAALSRALDWPEDHLWSVYRGTRATEAQPQLTTRISAVEAEIRELSERVKRLER